MTGRMTACLALLVVLLGGLSQPAGAAGRETLGFDRSHRGKPVRVTGELLLPDGASVTGKVAGVDASGALVLADAKLMQRGQCG